MQEPIVRLFNLTTWLVLLVILAVILLPQAIRILREYERGVIFRLGKLHKRGAKGPGIILLIPMVDRMVRMDLRVVTIDVAKQEIMTRDNVPATVDAVVYFRVIDPVAAVVKVENFLKATSLIAQTTLRSVLGQAPLDDLLSQRESINQKLQEIIDRQTEPWGIKVTAVEVKDVALPDTMKRIPFAGKVFIQGIGEHGVSAGNVIEERHRTSNAYASALREGRGRRRRLSQCPDRIGRSGRDDF